MRIWQVSVCAFLLVGLGACGGGTKLVKRPTVVPERTTPLAVANDAQAIAQLDWVIVRNGPGAWSKNADWDEYHLQLRNASDAPLRITLVTVTDSIGNTAMPLTARAALVKASKQTVARYRSNGLKVMAGRGGSLLVVAGIGAAATGVGIAAGTAAGAALGGGASVGAGAGAAAGGLILAGPVLIGMGIARAVNNRKVNAGIESRATQFPITVAPAQSRRLIVFVPISPSPTRITVHYVDGQGEHRLDIDTQAVLQALHLQPGA